MQQQRNELRQEARASSISTCEQQATHEIKMAPGLWWHRLRVVGFGISDSRSNNAWTFAKHSGDE